MLTDPEHPEHPHIGYTVADGVATVLLDRPDKLNALTFESAQAYLRTLRRAEADPDCRVILVTGAGRGFCAGADLAVLAEGGEALGSRRPDPDLPFDLGLHLPKPVIVAVNGPTAGMGVPLMLASDVRFMAEGATVMTVFSRLGLVAEYGISWMLPRLVGLGRATELLLSGRSVDAAEALAIGMVNEVVADDSLRDRATSYAVELAGNGSPRSFAAMKSQLLADQTATAREALNRSLQLMQTSFGWPDLPEGLSARAQKRAPRFAPL